MTTPPDEYVCDVFISYHQDAGYRTWVERHLLPTLGHWLKQELIRDPVIWWDTQLKWGETWPQRIATQLGGARVLVPLWSPFYFQRDWCVRELAYFLERQRKTQLAEIQEQWPLVFPLLIHQQALAYRDEAAAHIVAKDVTDEADPFMNEESPARADLSRKMREAAPALAEAILNPPPFDPEWKDLAVEECVALFKKGPQPQMTVPRIAA
jgi:hypothetical protein